MFSGTRVPRFPEKWKRNCIRLAEHIACQCRPPLSQRLSGKNKVSPQAQQQKEARNPGKINKHRLAGQNEASAPSRLRGNHDTVFQASRLWCASIHPRLAYTPPSTPWSVLKALQNGHKTIATWLLTTLPGSVEHISSLHASFPP